MKHAGLILLPAAALLPVLTSCTLHTGFGTLDGFVHEASLSMSFDPGNEQACLFVNNEGTAALVRYEETVHGTVNPEREYRLEVVTVTANGGSDGRSSDRSPTAG
jgi:hypothetical protein